MFAGVGCYSVILAKHSCPEKVYSVDINPVAIKFLKQNARLNRVEAKVQPILGDAKAIIEEKLLEKADRIIMPMPEKAYDYVETALQALKPSGGIIHYYVFEHSSKKENTVKKARERISEKLVSLGVDFDVKSARTVRATVPNWHHIAIDITTS